MRENRKVKLARELVNITVSSDYAGHPNRIASFLDRYFGDKISVHEMYWGVSAFSAAFQVVQAVCDIDIKEGETKLENAMRDYRGQK